MAFVPVPNTVQCRIQYASTTGTLAENVLYFATAGVPTTTDLEDIAEAVSTWLQSALMPVLSTDWSATQLNLRAMNEEEGISLVFVDGFPIDGSSEGVDVPFNVSYTVTLNTGYVGRSARGRVYGLGLLITNTISGNRLTDATQAALQGKWYGLMTTMATAGHAWQVVSFQEGGVIRAAGRPLPVLSVNVRFPLATQRRRLT